MMNVITVKNVSKKFKETIALTDLSFSVNEGEIFGFLGPSGAGKTTTIKLLTAQLIQTSGEVQVFGKEAFSNKKFIFDNVGIITDNSGFYKKLTVWENLKLFADIKGVTNDAIDEVLRKVSLYDVKKKEASKLSKGMKQRLMIALAVLHRPKLLFLDEPTSSLDPATTLEVHNLIKQLNQEGTTIFLTTHNMEEADKLCGRVAFLNQGEIVEIGNPNDLKLKYKTDNIKVILKNQKDKIVLKNSAETGLKIKEWMENNQLVSIHSIEPNLEEIFLDLTGRNLQ